MSDTTAMMDVTATMLPSTVMNDRSFDDQMASSAIIADSNSLFIAPPADLPDSPDAPDLLGLLPVVHFHQIPICHPAHRVVGTGDHLVTRLQARQHFEVLVAGDAHLDRQEFRLAASDDEH